MAGCHAQGEKLPGCARRLQTPSITVSPTPPAPQPLLIENVQPSPPGPGPAVGGQVGAGLVECLPRVRQATPAPITLEDCPSPCCGPL